MLIVKMLGGFIVSVKKVVPIYENEFIEVSTDIKLALELDANQIVK